MEFDPKKGDKVLVCYDGKKGRATVGEVLQRRGFAIQVEFKAWIDKWTVVGWFVRRSDQSFGGYLKSQESLMAAAFGRPGDWYSVFKMEAKDGL